MTSAQLQDADHVPPNENPVNTQGDGKAKRRFDWRTMLHGSRNTGAQASSAASMSDMEEGMKRPLKWSMGMLNDKETDEVPGSILLLSKAAKRNEPLGLRNTPARTSTSSLPSPFGPSSRASSIRLRIPQTPEKKKTADGKIVLEPQPDESLNDPLNWPTWRRDCALLSLGFYCMLGGGMTPILAAGFNQVEATYDVTKPQVALTTGLYMMGLGLGSVVASPTAILYGKRTVYLAGAIIFLLTSVWCALSPSYASLVIARIFMGFAVSPVECLPSATVAEIFFLHERAYRLGIYTLLLLGGKNLVPLVAAAIVASLGWRWIFWIVAIVVGFAGCLLFLFVPETFWDRTPRPHKQNNRPHRPRLSSHMSIPSLFRHGNGHQHDSPALVVKARPGDHDSYFGLEDSRELPDSPTKRTTRHAHFQDAGQEKESIDPFVTAPGGPALATNGQDAESRGESTLTDEKRHQSPAADEVRPIPELPQLDTITRLHSAHERQPSAVSAVWSDAPVTPVTPVAHAYTAHYSKAPPKSFVQTLKPYSGRLSKDNWFRVAFRPFILFAYPSILWSTVVYSLSVGWLIVLSESVSEIYQNRSTYNFTSLQTGLVYLSPFIGGILGTAVAGKVSDLIVRWLSRKNDGVYEPEFRLVMAIPVAVCTTIGLMGYGWSAAERDLWIVPTIFFGVISFGCSLGSTTAITFAVDSYRQYAGEALVTLNFSKNIFHGLVFSLFFNHWLESDGSRDVFLALGGIQMACLLFTIPMYIYGKRARMWTVRRNLMEKF